jgi:hypothetical protein
MPQKIYRTMSKEAPATPKIPDTRPSRKSCLRQYPARLGAKNKITQLLPVFDASTQTDAATTAPDAPGADDPYLIQLPEFITTG